MADQTLTVKIVGDEKDLLRAFRSSGQATQRFSASFGTFLKGALVFEGVRAGINSLGAAVRAGSGEFSEMQQVAAQTSAALKSTGGIANLTARDVERLAGRLSALSGIDDELIQSGANLLLTFKNVRNEIGKGNAIFDRATAAILDLNVRGFGPLQSVSKFVGKALNDPVRGLTALGRAGVQFTTRQRDLIKGLVETNRVVDAQKVVLREIESQVGGSAKAFGETLPGQLAKVREAFRNAFGDLVGVVAGPLSNALGAFSGFIPRIQQGAEQISATVGPALSRLVEVFTARLPELQRIAGSILDPLRKHVLPILQEFGAIASRVWANVVAVFDQNSGNLRTILSNLGQVLTNVWTLARPTIVFLFEKALPAALAVAIPVIEKLTGVTKVMSDIFVRVVSTIVRALDTFLGSLSTVADAASHLPLVGDKFAGVADKVNVGRESLRNFADDLDAIDGRKVKVDVVLNVAGAVASRAREGTVPQRGRDIEDKTTDAATDVIKQQERGAQNVQRAAAKAIPVVRNAMTAVEKQRKAFDDLMAKIGLRRDRAASTAGLKDDIVAAVDTKRALEEQLKVQKGNVDLQRQLQQANQELSALRTRQRQGRQFQALGLTAEGQQRVPGVGALRNRLGNLREQIKGTVLDTSKTRSQLARIAKVLSGQFGEVGRDVRAAILGMFNEISGGLKDGAKLTGVQTAFQKGGMKNLLKGLTDLDPATIKKLRQNYSQFGPGGTLPGQGVAAFGLAFPSSFAASGGGGAVREEFHIYIDGEEVESRVTRRQQKKRGRSAASRRGVRPGIGGV